MTITDTTERPQPPAWLNLDLIADEVFRAEAAALVDEIAAVLPTVRDLAIRTFRLSAKLNRAVANNHMPGGTWDWLPPLVGTDRLDGIWRQIDRHTWGALLEGKDADWYAEEWAKAGIPWGTPEDGEVGQ